MSTGSFGAVATATLEADEATRRQLIEAIIAESTAADVACTENTAQALITALENTARTCRGPQDVYFFSQKELDAVHLVLDVVVPDYRTVPPVGSAQAALSAALLTGDQVTFVHTKRHRDGEPGAVYCAMYVGVMIV